MALTCPKCEKINKCNCNSCNPDGKDTDLVGILYDEKLYQCCFCYHKFDEQDSLDFEWGRMIEDFAKRATPEMCLDWISLVHNERKALENSIGIGEFGFEQAFRFHFKMDCNDCDRDTFNKLKRDIIISNIINND
jgi:hypothetical protein